jgi:hypothetical protein
MFDDKFTIDDVRQTGVELEIVGTDNYRLEGRSTMAEISRDPLELVKQTISEHQYPDGFVLFLGTLFAPTQDRDVKGSGFTHKEGDVVRISTPKLGVLENRVTTSSRAALDLRHFRPDEKPVRGLLNANTQGPHLYPLTPLGCSSGVGLARPTPKYTTHFPISRDLMTETLTHLSAASRFRPGALESTNPSNTDEMSPVPRRREGQRGVKAARRFPGWSGSTPEVRADLLDKVGSMIIERKDALGKLASDRRQDPSEATGETVRAGRIFKYFAGEALRRHGRIWSRCAWRRDQTYPRSGRVYGLITPGISPSPFRLEDRPGAGLRQHRGAQVRQSHPGHAHALVSILHEAGAPAGIVNRCWAGISAMPSPSIPSQRRLLHRLADRGRQVAQAALSHRPRADGNGRQNPLRAGRCRIGPRHADRGGWRLFRHRPTLHPFRVFVQEGIYDKFVEGVAERARR